MRHRDSDEMDFISKERAEVKPAGASATGLTSGNQGGATRPGNRRQAAAREALATCGNRKARSRGLCP